MPERESPWWSADDDEFAGATPLFDGERRPRPGEDQAAGDTPGARDNTGAGIGPSAGGENPSAGEGPGTGGDNPAGGRRSTAGAWSQNAADVGSPIGEALKLAAAMADWSQKSGLTDTLKELAAEAADALAASAAEADAPEAPASARLLHIVTGAEGDPADPTVPIVVCDYCPLCRGVGVMRTVQPQVSQGLAEAMASLTSALTTAVESFAERRRHR